MSPNKKSILIGLVRCIGTREDEEQWEGVAAELSPGTSFNLFSLSLFLPLSFVLRVVVIGISHFTPRKDKNSTHPPSTLVSPCSLSSRVIYIVVTSVAVFLFHFLPQLPPPPLPSLPVNNTSINLISFVMFCTNDGDGDADTMHLTSFSDSFPCELIWRKQAPVCVSSHPPHWRMSARKFRIYSLLSTDRVHEWVCGLPGLRRRKKDMFIE